MSALLLAFAISSIAPWMPAREARVLASLITREAERAELDPAVLAAHVHVESRWNRRAVSPTSDYGLAQVHVAARGSARFLGRERELFTPVVNLREGARVAAMWRGYHMRECAEDKAPIGENAEPRRGNGGGRGSTRRIPTKEYPTGVTGRRDGHSFWAHMKWGRKVKSTEHADRVAALAALLRLQVQLYRVALGGES